MIAERVANALALDYPRELLEVIVASDGSTDAHRRARPRGGRRRRPRPRARRQGPGAERRRRRARRASCSRSRTRTRPGGPDALRRLVARFADPTHRLRHRPGRVPRRRRRRRARAAPARRAPTGASSSASADSSRRSPGVTAGNGAIYAVRREAYLPLPAAASHDLSFPFMLTKRGWRCSYEPAALAEERMAPTNEAEFARKRRMMRGIWDEVVTDGMLSPRGYGPAYAWEIASHRVAPLRDAGCSTWSRSRATSPCSARDRLRRHARRAGARPRRRGARRRASGRGRCGSPATTSSPPPRSRPASGTGPGSGRPGAWDRTEGTR